MTPQTESLLKDARALVRETRHIKRTMGLADFVAQLATALEQSEAIRESLEIKLQELAAELADREETPRARFSRSTSHI